MSHNFLFNASFHSLLVKIDQDIAREVQQQGCHCSKKLHQSNYPRSPVGISPVFRSYYCERLSFCCDTCRQRTTPPSVRFLNGRWFPAPFFILISVLKLGINERRLEQVSKHFGITVSESTWKRWRMWWRDSFMATRFWQQVKGLVPTSIFEGNQSLPRRLLSVFSGALEEKMRLLLRFLAPLTTSVLCAI
jgi:hypothetical protein